MYLDQDELERAARAFSAEKTELTGVLTSYLNMIDALGDVYGDDECGRQAREGFARARQKAEQYILAICTAYGAVGEKIALMSRNVEVTDWNIIASLPGVDTTIVPRTGR